MKRFGGVVLNSDVDVGTAAPLSVLVADDDVAMRRLCRAVLERASWRVLEAADGEEAVQQACRHLPDVILMDVLMPRLDGLQATRKLRSRIETQFIPVIAMSAKGEASDIAAGFEAGTDEYLTKPLDPKEIVARVRSMARLSRATALLMHSNEALALQTDSLHTILDYTTALAKMEDLGAIFDLTLHVTSKLTACQRACILLPTKQQKTLEVARSIGYGDRALSRLTVPVGGAISGAAFATKTPIVLNSLDEAQRLHDVRYDDDMFGTYPLVSAPLCSLEKAVGVLNVTQRLQRKPFCEQDLEYLNLIANHAAAAIDAALTREGRNQARDSVVMALAKLAEHRDDDTGRHLDRMTQYCVVLAEQLRANDEFVEEINDEFIANLHKAAPLHDIGKVAVPDSILLKPGRLTPEEMAVMRRHVTAGAETLRSILAESPDSRFLQMAVEIAEGHHEWYDGKGYPKGVAGERIPLSARIAALADVYDALTTRRVYKEPIPHHEAAHIIISQSGEQFDPRIVDAFMFNFQEFERLAIELADDASPRSNGMRESPSAHVETLLHTRR